MAELRRILCVEDEPDIRMVLEVALGVVGGFDVRVLASGEEAIRVGPGLEPDLILLDVMMPEMDGPTTLAAIRDVPELADVPVAFLTAKVQPQEIERFMRLGAIGVIHKPFDPMALGDEVRRVWQRAARD